MTWMDTSPERLRRLFLQGFTVMDIAEPLASFDAGFPAERAVSFMLEREFDLVGVRTEGLVDGYAVREDLARGGTVGDHLVRFGPDDCVPDTASLVDAIQSLGVNRRCFVSQFDVVSAIVTLQDLEKPPVRMFLFGMVTIAEMLFVREIRGRFPDGGWTGLISAGRLEKAEVLLAERRRRGHDADLLGCLQFSDKGQILLRDPAAREVLGFPSRKEGLRALRELETLRNHLAHTQGIIADSWERIVKFSGNLDTLLGRL